MSLRDLLERCARAAYRGDPGVLRRALSRLPAEIVAGPLPAGAREPKTPRFGVVRDGDCWTVLDAFAGLAGPVLLREAILLGFETATADAAHLANFVAHESIATKEKRARFWEAWRGRPGAGGSMAELTTNPALYYLQLELGSTVTPWQFLSAWHAGDGYRRKLLGRPPRYRSSLREAWLASSVLPAWPAPDHVEVHVALEKLRARGVRYPSKGEIIDEAMARPVFPTTTRWGLHDAFATVSRQVMEQHYLDTSALGLASVDAYVVAKDPGDEARLLAALQVPHATARYLRVSCAGVPGSTVETPDGLVTVQYIAPLPMLEGPGFTLRDHLVALRESPAVAHLDAFYNRSLLRAVNHGQYEQTGRRAGRLVNLRHVDRDDLLFASEHSFAPRPGRLAEIPGDVAAFMRFLNAAGTFYRYPMRQGATHANVAAVASITQSRARRWLARFAPWFFFVNSSPAHSPGSVMVEKALVLAWGRGAGSPEPFKEVARDFPAVSAMAGDGYLEPTRRMSRALVVLAPGAGIDEWERLAGMRARGLEVDAGAIASDTSHDPHYRLGAYLVPSRKENAVDREALETFSKVAVRHAGGRATRQELATASARLGAPPPARPNGGGRPP